MPLGAFDVVNDGGVVLVVMVTGPSEPSAGPLAVL